MKSIMRWAGIILGFVAALVILLAVVVYALSEARMRRVYQTPDVALEIPTDADSIERGSYLTAALVGCRDCHGPDLGGKVFIDDPSVGLIYGPNLTRGAGSVTVNFSDADWERSLRHGVGPDGRALLAMPSVEFMNLNQDDLAAVIAYLKSIPPIDREGLPTKISPIGRVLFVVGVIPPPAAEVLDHSRSFPAPIQPGTTVEYGGYLASLACIGCHKPDFSGGKIAGTPPDWPPAPALNSRGAMRGWTLEEFTLAIRAGVTPDRRALNPVYMPWTQFTNLTDRDLQALYAYLQSVP